MVDVEWRNMPLMGAMLKRNEVNFTVAEQKGLTNKHHTQFNVL